MNKLEKFMNKIKTTIMDLNLSTVDVGTWRRLLMFVIGIVVFICGRLNVEIPIIDENTATEIIIDIIGLLALLQGFWKNNSFTQSAQEADEIMKIKKEEI